MNNYTSLEAIKEQQRQRLSENICSMTDEAYIIFRHRNSTDIEVANCPRVFFTPEISYYDNNTFEATVTIQSGTEDEVREKCKDLYNEHFKIKDYEEQIGQLKEELAEVKRQRNRKWFETIYMITSKTMCSDYQTVVDSDDNDLFMVWSDFNYLGNEELVFYMKLPSDFTSSDYYRELFKPNIVNNDFDVERGWFVADSPNISHNGHGCNHWCTLTNKKALEFQVERLKYYMDSKQIKLRCNDVDYLYNRLDEIWEQTFGTEHNRKENK